MKTGCTFNLDEAVKDLYKGTLKKEEAIKSIEEKIENHLHNTGEKNIN